MKRTPDRRSTERPAIAAPGGRSDSGLSAAEMEHRARPFRRWTRDTTLWQRFCFWGVCSQGIFSNIPPLLLTATATSPSRWRKPTSHACRLLSLTKSGANHIVADFRRFSRFALSNSSASGRAGPVPKGTMPATRSITAEATRHGITKASTKLSRKNAISARIGCPAPFQRQQLLTLVCPHIGRAIHPRAHR